MCHLVFEGVLTALIQYNSHTTIQQHTQPDTLRVIAYHLSGTKDKDKTHRDSWEI